MLPGSTKKIFESRSKDFRIVKTDDGYAARFAGWDGLGGNVLHKEDENKVYLFDKSFNFLEYIEFPDYIYDMIYADKALYVQSDKNYISYDGKGFKPLSGDSSFPVSNGKYAITRKNDDLYNQDKKICYESTVPHEIFSAGDIFYYRKSWKSYYTDNFTKNILSVSKDGVNWVDLSFPDKFYDLMNVKSIGNKIYVDCKYEVFTFDNALSDEIKVNLNNELLAFDVPVKTVNDRTMVPLRFFFEKLNAKVNWNDETKEITINKDNSTIVFKIDSKTAIVNGEEKNLDAPPYIESEKTMIPARFLTENLGYQVLWDDNTKTVSILTDK